VLKKFFWIFFEVVVIFLVAYFFSIQAEKSYEWYVGLFHGAVAVPNYVISLVKDGHLYRATTFVPTYNYAWWVFFVFTGAYYVSVIFRLLLIRK